MLTQARYDRRARCNTEAASRGFPAAELVPRGSARHHVVSRSMQDDARKLEHGARQHQQRAGGTSAASRLPWWSSALRWAC